MKPSILDNSWYPSRRDIKNHIHKTTWLKKLSQIDQVNLDELVSQWKKDDHSCKEFGVMDVIVGGLLLGTLTS